MIEIIEHDAGRIRELRLARPPVNALSIEVLRDLTAKLEQSAATVEALVISGQPGVFSAGLDVPAMLKLDRDGISEVFIELWRAQRALAHCAVPVVFALTGHCPAGGTVLAIHGDYRVMASGNFRVGLNEVQVGLFPGGVIHGAFARLTGGHAAQLLTRGALVDPATALRVGLVDELAEPAQVCDRAVAVAREFVSLPREPMARTRALVRNELMNLFGSTGNALLHELEFATLAADLWFVPATQDMLKTVFAKRPS